MNMDTRASVSIVRCESYEEAKLYEAVTQVAREGGMPDVAGKTILLKPNILSDSSPEDCITTNPEFVRATIKLLKNCGAKEILPDIINMSRNFVWTVIMILFWQKCIRLEQLVIRERAVVSLMNWRKKNTIRAIR